VTKDVFPQIPVIITDDYVPFLETIKTLFEKNGINNIILCKDGNELEQVLKREQNGIILLDLTLPGTSGIELLNMIKAEYPNSVVIIVTANTDLHTAIECMKSGAFDYWTKSESKTKLVSIVKKSVEIQELRMENIALTHRLFSQQLENPEYFQDIITQQQEIINILLYSESIAKSSQTVMITGETGTGKEVIARAIHKASGREGKFVAVNVAGNDDMLFADTLFGHIKGAYAGAEQKRSGLIEEAAQGTLFLDEIGELSPNSQKTLLRLLESGEYYPIGSDTPMISNTRIIAATNKDPRKLDDPEVLRKDLYYRFRTHHIHLPPLRERKQDIPLLLDHFLTEACDEMEKKKPSIREDLIDLLESYQFPGNVRELKSMVYDAVSRHQSGKLGLQAFRDAMKKSYEYSENTEETLSPVTFASALPTIKEATHLLIHEALERTKGNQAAAAQLLGISPQALSKRLKKLRENKRSLQKGEPISDDDDEDDLM